MIREQRVRLYVEHPDRDFVERLARNRRLQLKRLIDMEAPSIVIEKQRQMLDEVEVALLRREDG